MGFAFLMTQSWDLHIGLLCCFRLYFISYLLLAEVLEIQKCDLEIRKCDLEMAELRCIVQKNSSSVQELRVPGMGFILFSEWNINY